MSEVGNKNNSCSPAPDPDETSAADTTQTEEQILQIAGNLEFENEIAEIQDILKNQNVVESKPSASTAASASSSGNGGRISPEDQDCDDGDDNGDDNDDVNGDDDDDDDDVDNNDEEEEESDGDDRSPSSSSANGDHAAATPSSAYNEDDLFGGTSKLFQYIKQLESSQGRDADEWENDDDTGYMLVTLSEEEFYELEEEASRILLSPAGRRASAAKELAEEKLLSRRGFDEDDDDEEEEEEIIADHGRMDINSHFGGDSDEEGGLPAEKAVYEGTEDDAAAAAAAASSAPVSVLQSPEKESADMSRWDNRSEEDPSRSKTPDGPPATATAVPSSSSGAGTGKDNSNNSSNSNRSSTSVPAPPTPDSLSKGTFKANAAVARKAKAERQRRKSQLAAATKNRRQSISDQRRNEIMGQEKFMGADGKAHCYFNLKVVFEPNRTGFESTKDMVVDKGTIIAGRYEIMDVLGSAAFSTALQCADLAAEPHEAPWVCLKVIKNNKDFFDQSLDEIKLLQYINSNGDADENHVLRLIDFFYCKEHLVIVSELLKENLYEFGRFIRESDLEPYYTMPRLKRIMFQILEALEYIHSLKLIHCDIKPENIVIKSFSRCEVKLIDFGSSCFTTDHLTTYIQSRSYRAPEVILGHHYDDRIDIWSMGAVLAELYTGYVLFQNDSVATMLSRITGVLGNFPQKVLRRGKESGKYFSIANVVFEREEGSGKFQLIFPKKTTLAHRLHLDRDADADDEYATPRPPLTRDEKLFIDFVRQLLHLDPSQRPTASEALCHPWMADAETVEFSEYIIGQPAAPPGTASAGSSGSAGLAPPPPPPEYDEYEEDEEEEEEDDDEDEDDLHTAEGGDIMAGRIGEDDSDSEQEEDNDDDDDDDDV